MKGLPFVRIMLHTALERGVIAFHGCRGHASRPAEVASGFTGRFN